MNKKMKIVGLFLTVLLGSSMAFAAGSCGTGKCGTEMMKDTKGSSSAGKCGAEMMKNAKGSCGAGKCGSEMKDVNSMIQNSLPTDFDFDTKVNLNSIGTNGLSLGAGANNPVSSVENNTFNIYSPKDSPSEYARRIRQEIQYQKMVG